MHEQERFLRLPQVRERTGLGRTSIYNRMQDNAFPRPVPLGGNAVAWAESEVTAWIQEQIRRRDKR
jgi:prophage regulatory protein